MALFTLIYIAVLLSLDIICKYSIIIHYFIPLIALVVTGIIYAIYFLTNKSKGITHKLRANYQTKETEEERKKRVNTEVDKIIDEMRKGN